MKAYSLLRLAGASLLVLLGGVAGEARADVVHQAWASPPRVIGPLAAPDTNHMVAVLREFDMTYTFTVGQIADGYGGSEIGLWRFEEVNGIVVTSPGFPQAWTDHVGDKAYPVAVVLGDGTLNSPIFVLGAFPYSGQGLDVVLIRYDYDGQGMPVLTWKVSFNNADQNGDDYPVAMTQVVDGTIWIAAASAGPGTGLDYQLLGYDSVTGARIPPPASHIDRYNNDGTNKSDVPVDIKALPVVLDGQGGGGQAVSIVITGTSYDNSTKNDILTIEYLYVPGTGLLIYTNPGPLRYTGPAGVGAVNQVPTSLDIIGVSGTLRPAIFISGSTDHGTVGTKDFLLVGYPRTGDPAVYWERITDGDGHFDDVAVKVVVQGAHDNNIYVFVTGTVWNGGAFGYDVLTQAFATAGGPPVWSAPSHRVGDDFAADMAVNIGGWVYVTGKASNGVDFDYLTTKLESLDGSALWNIAYNAPSGGTDAAASIALLDTANVRYPDVYITGRSQSNLQLSAKYATIRYTQSQ